MIYDLFKTGSFVSIKRGCGRSVGAVATSSGGNGVSTSVQSCSTDLCNSGDGLQNFNINDFISNFNIPNVSGSYPNNPGYPAGAVPGLFIYLSWPIHKSFQNCNFYLFKAMISISTSMATRVTIRFIQTISMVHFVQVRWSDSLMQ